MLTVGYSHSLSAQTYCNSNLYFYGCGGYGDYIASFSTSGGITNINNNSTCANPFSSYAYYSLLNCTAVPGTVINFSYKNNPNYSELYGIWVDWNHDGDFFDPGEKVFSPTTQTAINQIQNGSFIVPFTASSGVTRLRIRCTDFTTPFFGPCSNEDYGECEDYNFTVQPLPSCTGMPNFSATTSSGIVCANVAFTLSTQGVFNSGLSFQWQSSSQCANTFMNIAGATNANYTVQSGISASTDYRVIVTCNNSGLIDTSNILGIIFTSNCYCLSAASLGTGADIGRIRIGNATYSYANPIAPPALLTNNSSANATYTNFLSSPTINLIIGIQYFDTITQINSGSQIISQLTIYIDYNQNGVFDFPSEIVSIIGGSSIPSANTFTGNFMVADTAKVGFTRMRLRLEQNGNGPPQNSCGNYSAGETEDYTVFIQPQAPVASNNGPVCGGQPVTLNVTPNLTCATYSWTGPNGYSSNLPNPTINNAVGGVYSVTYTYYGVTYGPATTTVVAGLSTNDTLVTVLCAGDTLFFNNQAITSAGFYAQTFTNSGGCDSIITQNVSVNPLPAPPIVTSPIAYCQGAPTMQLTAIGTNILWYTSLTGGVGSAVAPTPSSATVGVFKFYLSQTVNGCTSLRDSIVVNVNLTPSITTATSSNPTTCLGTNGSITLSGLLASTSYAVSYQLGGNPQPTLNIVTSVVGTLVISNLSAGTYSNIIVTSLNCPSAPAGPFTLSDPPIPVIGSSSSLDPTTCGGADGSITLNGLTASTSYVVNYTFNGTPQPALNIVSNNSGTLIISNLASGTYSNVNVTITGCTSLPAGPFILSPPLTPIITSVTNNGPLCAGNSLTLTSSTISGATYIWTGPNGFTSALQNPTIASVTVANAGSYSVTATVNGCTSIPVSTTVIVNPMPATPVATSNSPVCEGSALNLFASAIMNATYSWTGPNSFSSTIQNPVIAAATIAAGGIYTVNATVNNCVSANGSVTVVVNPIPLTPVTTDTTYCQFSTSVPLTAIAAGTLNWYSVPTGGSALPTPTPSTTTVGTTTYYVSQTVNGCESPRTPLNVLIIAKPAAPTVTSPILYCQNQTAVPLTATGSNLLYYTQAVGGVGTAIAPTPITSTVGNTSYYVSQTVNGCESDRATIVVTVATTPQPPVVNSPVIYCLNQTTLTPLTSFVTGTGLMWYTVPTGGIGSATAPVISTTATDTTTYYISQSVGTCESGRTPITVEIRALSAPPTVSNITYCQFVTPVALTAVGQNLLWYTVPTGGVGTATAPTPSTTTSGTFTFYVSQTTNLCESPRAAIIVTVNPKPAAPTVTSPILYCQNQAAVPLTATGSNLLYYTQAVGGVGSATAPTPITTAIGSISYYISQTVNGCESDRATFVVTVATTPQLPVVNSPVIYCLNQTTLTPLTSFVTGAGLMWYTVPTGGTGSATAPIVSTATTDTTTYYVSQSVGTCESGRTPITVEIRVLSAPPVVSNITYCQFVTPVALTAVGQNLLWYTVPTGGVGTATAPTPSTTVSGTFTFYVSQTTNLCESPRAAIIVTVNLKPAAPTVTSPILYCQNQAAVPLMATGSNLLYYTQAVGSVGTAIAPTPVTTTVGNTSYYVSQTVNGCESDRDTIIVTILATPTAPVLVTPVVYCQFETNPSPISSFVTGTNILYYAAPSGGVGSNLSPVINTNIADTITYYVSQTVGTCESPRAAIVVEIRLQPQPPITNLVTYCQFENSQPLTAIGNNLQWYSAAMGGAGSATAPIPSTNVPGIFQYYVSQNINGCESNRDSVTVVINPQPAPPTVVPTITYCQFDSNAAMLSAIGQNLLWYTSATGGTGSNTAPIPSTQTSGTFTFYVSQTILGCESNRAAINVIVLPKPAAPGLVSPVLLCQDDVALPLTAQGQNLKWYVDATSLLSYPNAPVPPTDSVKTLFYYVSQTVNGCESDRAMITVQVNPKVFAALMLSNTLFCQFDTIQVSSATVNNPASASYVFNFDGGDVLNGSGAGPYIVSFNTQGTKNITVTVSNLNCSATDSKTVTVKPAPNAEFNVQSDVCKDEKLTVQAAFANVNDDSFEWDFAGADVLNGAGPGFYTLRYTTPGIKVLSLRTTLNGCRSPLFYDTLTVHDFPNASISFASNNDICSNDSILFSAQNLGTTYSYTWTPYDLFINNGQSSVYAQVPNTRYIYLTVADRFGCSNVDSLLINTRPCCDITLPTAFSPNNDGQNDRFRIITQGNHAVSIFRIVNRWGQTVYESLNENDGGWDGNMQGQPQPIGTYQYFLRYRCFNGEIIEKKGDVILIR